MTRREDHGSTLSAHRAFVVHLGPIGGRRRRRFRGRVEHLSSGASARFSSLGGLLAFFAAVGDATPGGRRNPDDQRGSERSTTSTGG